eukprot:maker-scaffold135_size322082-snap-gene-2.15 protein:Tk07974 transcript:maker-scaffold135_size322082-snap-gene-2.15-mRNA-1 annotation:"PREDICTED: uncharacterized protein LOC658432"
MKQNPNSPPPPEDRGKPPDPPIPGAVWSKFPAQGVNNPVATRSVGGGSRPLEGESSLSRSTPSRAAKGVSRRNLSKGKSPVLIGSPGSGKILPQSSCSATSHPTGSAGEGEASKSDSVLAPSIALGSHPVTAGLGGIPEEAKPAPLLVKSQEKNITDKRSGRLFSLFNIVTFTQASCTLSSDNSMKGTCMTNSECTTKSGRSDGSCAAGFGI